MKSLKRLINNNENDFIIKWRFTSACNLDCSYCIRKARTTKIDFDVSEYEERLKDVAKRIDALIEKSPFYSVGIDVIGGEVSIFDMENIFSSFHSDKIKKINLTTNFMRTSEYYNSLAEFLKSKGIKLTITASFHFEYQSFEKYFEKIEKVRNNCYLFTAEMVSLENNQPLAKRFVDKCEEIGIDYMLEADLRSHRYKGDIVDNILYCSKKKNKSSRYEVEFMDGTIQDYVTRNAFLKDTSVKENRYQKGVCTAGFKCTNSYDFIYIDFDTVVGRTKTNKSCSNRIVIEDFELVEPCECVNCVRENDMCSLCGNMNLERI